MLESLVEIFSNAAEAHWKATEEGDSEKCNLFHDKVVETIEEIRSKDPNLQCLVPLLTRPNPSVQIWVASHLISIGYAEAEQVLEELSKKAGLVGFEAEMVLSEWRSGKLI